MAVICLPGLSIHSRTFYNTCLSWRTNQTPSHRLLISSLPLTSCFFSVIFVILQWRFLSKQKHKSRQASPLNNLSVSVARAPAVHSDLTFTEIWESKMTDTVV
ncbi:hypothetical protein ILYODFUR_008794 [Ilyodon furcidens]|uniref:Uncharacterized protein n=1 Tax=Ilyodon furcidens TaxID=33524 RepID=A0ABV0TJL1_9TELE